MTIRQPAVAGLFYPADPDELRRQVDALIQANHKPGGAPKALIAPHAGYRFSGPVAASGYSLLEKSAGHIRRVVLLGPAHCLPLAGIALPETDTFATPLGGIPVDPDARRILRGLDQVCEMEAAHAGEHSLEVHLPFLQTVLGDISLVPLVVGRSEADEVAEVIDCLWGGGETLVVVSSDLSHYLDYRQARKTDARTHQAILRGEPALTPEQACGCYAINGLIRAVKHHGMEVELLDMRNSGDTAGPRDRVVGYAAYGIH